MKQPQKKNLVEFILTHRFWTGIVGIATILLLIVAILPLVPHPSHQPNPTQTITTTSPTQAPSTSPSASSTPIPINQTMSCTNCETWGNFVLIVKYATFDPAQSQVTLLIGVKNISTGDQSEVQFKYLKLQDTQTGVTTYGGGEGFSSFDISVNSQMLFRPTFQFVPVTGHEYSLTAELAFFDVGWAYPLFNPITIKFG